MNRYTVSLVAVRRYRVEAEGVDAAEAVALALAGAEHPGLTWLVSDTEEDGQ